MLLGIFIISMIVMCWNNRKDLGGFDLIILFPFISMLFVAVVGFTSQLFIDANTEILKDGHVKETPIYSAKLSQAELNGHFETGFLLGGSGEMNSTRYYYFHYKREDGDIQLGKLTATNTALRRTDDRPPARLDYYDVHRLPNFVDFIMWPHKPNKDSLEHTRIVLVIPTNSIEINMYDLNVK
jgi:hypothetical protein